VSVTLNKVEWEKLGRIPTGGDRIGYLRIAALSQGGYFTFTRDGNYKAYTFSTGSGALTHNNLVTYTIPFSGSPPAYSLGALGTWFAWFFSSEIKHYDPPNLYLLKKAETGFVTTSLEGFDATDSGYVAYSIREQGGSFAVDNRGLNWGIPSGTSLDPSEYIDVGFTGNVRLSRNGLNCCVFGQLNGALTIRVYRPQNGVFSNPISKIGGDIIQNGILDVLINDGGTRIIARTNTQIFYYELVTSQWVLQSTLAIPSSIQGFAINSDASILVVCSGSSFNTYTLSGGAWILVSQVGATIASNVYSIFPGSQIALAQDSVFLALNSETGTDIYRSTISQVTYDAPVITPGQSFTLAENTFFSTTPAMLVDGLNRQVTSWSASGLPAGLSINASTGIISGTAMVKGQFSATITATNPAGSSTEAVQFIVQSAIPIFAGAFRALAIYAGAAAVRAIYYGEKKLWSAPEHH